MPWNVVLLVLLGAALHASWNLLVKVGLNRQMHTLLVVSGAGAISAFASLLLPHPASACYPFLAASVFIHLVYFGLVAWAYQKGDLSVVYPLTRGSAPALTTLAAMAFLGEWPTGGAWIGILLISLGAFLLVGDARRVESSQHASIGLALANSVVIVLYTLVDGVGARESGRPLSYTAWMLAITAGLMFLTNVVLGKMREFPQLGSNWKIGVLGGASLFASYGLALWAMTLAPIAMVGALRETSIVFGVILAGFVLQERITRLRYLSIASIGVGAIFLKMG